MNVFEVGVVVHLVDKVSAAMGVVTRSLMAGQTQANALNTKLASIQNTFMSGALMMGGGLALAMPLIACTNEAAKLEMALKRVQVATQSSTNDMKGFKDIFADVANRTAVFSMPDLANFSAEMAASGIRTASDIKALLPMFAEAADVLKVTAHIGPEQTAHVLSAMAHQFGRYKPEEMRPIIEAVTALAPRLPGGVKGFAGMGGYVNILGSRLLGIDPKELLTLQATAMQTTGGSGTGARGALSGAMIMNTLMRAIPGVFGSGLLEGKSAFALRSMGLTDAHGRSTVMENGKMRLDKFLDKLASFQDRTQSAGGRIEIAKEMMKYTPMLNKKQPDMDNFLQSVISSGGKIAPAELSMKLFAYAFGAGSRVAAAMSDPKFRQQHAFLQGEVNRAPSVEQRQKQLMETLMMQQTRLGTNIKSLMAVIGDQALPILTNVTKVMADWVDGLRKFFSQHPKVTQAIIGITAVAAAILFVAGAGLVMQAACMGIAFVMAPLSPMILLVVAAVAAVIAIVMNWGNIMKWCSEQIYKVNVFLVGLGNAVIGFANTAARAINGLLGTKLGTIQSFQAPGSGSGSSSTPVFQSGSAIMAARYMGTKAGHTTVIHDHSVNTGPITIHQQPGESHEQLLKKFDAHLSKTAQQSARSLTSGKGSHNSKFLHGGGHE